jgi:hypothetical protein
MVNGDLKEACALSEKHVRKHVAAFKDDNLTLNKSSPNKMMYDSIRIIGLMLTSVLDKTLIRLLANPQNQELKVSVVRTLICFCYNTMLLK